MDLLIRSFPCGRLEFSRLHKGSAGGLLTPGGRMEEGLPTGRDQVWESH